MNQTEPLHVVAGVIYNSQRDILLARRPAHVHQGGLWEFAGGKCQIGEAALPALVRELDEELGIVVEQARPLIRIHHAYPDKNILLDVWQIEQWHGQAYGREGQEVQWCRPDHLKKHSFPAANLPIRSAIQLPSWYLITPEPLSLTDKKFFYRLEACLDRPEISLLQLRAKTLSERDYCYCAEKVLGLCERYAAQLLINASPEMAKLIGTHGVHLNSERLLAAVERPLSSELWVAASGHSLAEIEQANRIGVDFMVLGPVRTTASHPDSPPLGWFEMFQLTEHAHCPVFALGGMTIEDVPTAWAHGAQGVAAIRGLWNLK